MKKDKKQAIKLEITRNTRNVIEQFGLKPSKIDFWRVGLTAYATYKAGFFKVIKVSTLIEEDSSNAALMYELCEEIVRKI